MEIKNIMGSKIFSFKKCNSCNGTTIYREPNLVLIPCPSCLGTGLRLYCFDKDEKLIC